MSEFGALKLQSEIDSRIGALVEGADRLISDRSNKLEGLDMNSQLRNVMAVANDAPHVAVVISFIRYQMGRAGAPGKAWKGTGLGEAVIKEIDGELHNLAQEAVRESSFGNADEVHTRLTRLLLGFMYRRYVYESDRLKAGGRK
jgi:hypothetical protein